MLNERPRSKEPAGVLADCGESVPPQEAATGNPENHWRFRVLPKWTCDRPPAKAGAMEGFFYGQLAVTNKPVKVEVNLEEHFFRGQSGVTWPFLADVATGFIQNPGIRIATASIEDP